MLTFTEIEAGGKCAGKGGDWMQAVSVDKRKIHSHEATNAGARPLAMADRGVAAKVCSLRGNEEQRHFLQSLGFAPGAEVTVVSELAGDLIVDVKGSRIALGRQIAHKIMVE